MNTMTVTRRLVISTFRIFFVGAISAVVLFSAVPELAHAGPTATGGCGVTWEYTYTLVTNPFPPGSAGEAAFRFVYGGDSYAVQSTYQVARIDDEGGGCIEEPVAPPSNSTCTVTGTVGQPVSFNLVPTGNFPDGYVRYGVRWSGAGARVFYPDDTTWYESAPNPTTISNTWTAPGTYTMSVYAQSQFGSTQTQVSINGNAYASEAQCNVVITGSVSAGIIAVPSAIDTGGSSSLSWSSSYATSCTGTNFSTGGATSGSLIVSPADSTVYSVTCTDGTRSASSNASVTVNPPPGPTATLNANPGTVTVGAPSTLTWSSTNAISCAGTNFSTGSATAGSVTVFPTQTKSYLVSCTGAGGSASASRTVTVTAIASPTVSLSATPTSLNSGALSTLTWTSTNAISCEGSGFDTGGNISGSVSIGPITATTNYSITCTGPSSSVTASPISGTWQHSYDDISDFYCNAGQTRVSSLNLAYSGLAWCPSNPAGQACSGVGNGNICKINVANNACQIETAVYQCVGASVGTESTTQGRVCTGTALSPTWSEVIDGSAGNTAPSVLGEYRSTYADPSGLSQNPQNFCFQNSVDEKFFATNVDGQTRTGRWYSGAGTAAYTNTYAPNAGTYSHLRSVTTVSSGTVSATPGLTAFDTVTVQVNSAALSGSCSVSPTSVYTGRPVTWTAVASGGTGPYTYSWSGTDGLSGATASVSKTYTTAGTKTGSITVTDPSGTPSVAIQGNMQCSGGTQVASSGSTEDGVGFGGGADSTLATECEDITPAGGCCNVVVREVSSPGGGSVNTYYHYRSYSGASMVQKDSTTTTAPSGNRTNFNYFAGMASASNASVTTSCSNSVVVGVSLADLTTGSLSPASVTAGANTTFTAGVNNTGGATTPVFGSRMYVCLSSDSACLNNYLTQSDSIWSRIFSFFINFAEANTSIKIPLSRISIVAGGSGTQTGSYTFPSPGSYQMRFCADTPLNEVSESNELDNCSAWTSLSVNPGALSASCSPSPSTGYVGDSLTWSVTPSGGVGSYTYVWSGTDGLLGTGATVSKTYGSAGTKSASVIVTSGAGSVTATCVTGTIQNTPTVIITVSPPVIVKGVTSPRIDWTSSYATSCTGTNFPTGGATVGSVTVSPPVTTTYGITCTNGTRSASSSATVTVNPADITLSISPAVTVRQGDPATVSWGVVGTPDTCSISGPGLSSTAFSGAQSVIINQQSTYTMNCLTGGVPSTKSVTIGVTPRFDEF